MKVGRIGCGQYSTQGGPEVGPKEEEQELLDNDCEDGLEWLSCHQYQHTRRDKTLAICSRRMSLGPESLSLNRDSKGGRH